MVFAVFILLLAAKEDILRLVIGILHIRPVIHINRSPHLGRGFRLWRKHGPESQGCRFVDSWAKENGLWFLFLHWLLCLLFPDSCCAVADGVTGVLAAPALDGQKRGTGNLPITVLREMAGEYLFGFACILADLAKRSAFSVASSCGDLTVAHRCGCG